MDLLIHILLGILFLFIVPWVLGLVWRNVVQESVVGIYLLGMITMMGIFEILLFPTMFMNVAFHTQAIICGVILIAVSCGIGAYFVCNKRSIFPSLHREAVGIPTMSGKIYLLAFLLLLGIQLYYTLFYDVGEWTSDDGSYVVYASAAVYDDGIGSTDLYGDFTSDLSYKRSYTAINMFYAFFVYVTGISAPAVEHTVFAVLWLLLSYAACGQLATQVCPKKEDRRIFLVFVALLYLFGMCWQYSTSFRLLSTIWQGKAVLAVVILPLLFFLYARVWKEKFSWKYIALFFVISLAAVSLTLGGIVTMVMVCGLLSVACFVASRKAGYLIYLIAGTAFPAVIGWMVYLNHYTMID